MRGVERGAWGVRRGRIEEIGDVTSIRYKRIIETQNILKLQAHHRDEKHTWWVAFVREMVRETGVCGR